MQPRALPPENCSACTVRMQAVYAPASAEELKQIRALRRRTVVAGPRRIILREGDGPDEIYTLFSGWAYRFKLQPDGRRQILSYLLPGDLVSPQLLAGQPLHFSVQTLTEVTLCAFDRRAFADFIAARPAVAMNFAAHCLRKAAVLDYRIVDLGRRSAQERIARFVLQLEAWLRARGLAEGDHWSLPLRQEHIADTLGLTVVHVSRTLAALRQAGVMTFAHGTVTIHDRERMAEIAGPLLPSATAGGGA